MCRHTRRRRWRARRPRDGSDEGPEEGAMLKLGLLEGDEKSCPERLSDTDGEVEGPADG
jgi:hypothetical protein